MVSNTFLSGTSFVNWKEKSAYSHLINILLQGPHCVKKNNKLSQQYKFFFYEKNLYYRSLNLLSNNLIYPSLYSIPKKKITGAMARKISIEGCKFNFESKSFPGEIFYSCYYYLKEFLKNGISSLTSFKKKNFFWNAKKKKNVNQLYFPKKKIYLEMLKNSLQFLNLKF
jgi:hypothetical protein